MASDPSGDPMSRFDLWQPRVIFTIAAVIGLCGLAHELFLTSTPSWLKILASCTAISGRFVSLLNIAGRTGSK